MSYLDLINRFWCKHLEYSFTPNEVAVWFHLLNRCNALSWKNPFNLAVDRLMLELHLKTQKPLDTARNKLREAGLIDFKNGLGRGITTEYTIVGLNGSAEKAPEKGKKNNPFLGAFSENSERNPPEKGKKNNPYKGGTTIDKEKEESNTASAATPSLSFSAEKSEKGKPTASKKKAAAHADEVAALELPHPGKAFAQLWAEFRAMPKQVKKPVTSLRRLLTTLGKYEEGFAQLMLEKAIEGNWSGVEFDGTAKTYAEWRAVEAARAHRQPTRTNSGTNDSPAALNHAFVAQVTAQAQREEDAHFARWQVPSVPVDPNKEFGYTQSAEEGLAQARNTPEYQQYLAELAAQEQQADTPPEAAPPTPDSEAA